MLLQKKCIPCQLGTPPLTVDQINTFLPELDNDWLVEDAKMLKRTIGFTDFNQANVFVQKVANLAEHEGHHPDIHFGWGYVTIHLMTHKIKGLSESDFILAAKIDALD